MRVPEEVESRLDLHKGQVGDTKKEEQELQVRWPLAQQGMLSVLLVSLGNSRQTEHCMRDKSIDGGGGVQEQEGAVAGGGVMFAGRSAEAVWVWFLVLTMMVVAEGMSSMLRS
jgi:hypothetical protein